MDNILKTLLYEWKERTLPELIPRSRPLKLQNFTDNNSVIVTGFRRVGKTYLLFDAIQELLKTYTREEVVYINFEDERVIPNIDLLTNLIPEIQKTYRKKPLYLFLDELQIIPSWSKWVRRILDTEKIKLYITGSSSKMSSFELPTELRGRSWEFPVLPLSFNEFLRFKAELLDFEKIKFDLNEQARFSYLFEEYLIFGGLPAVVLTEKENKQELLQSYFQTVIQKEIGERFHLQNESALKILLKLLINSNYITISKLTNSLKSLGISMGKSTVDNYISYIESSYFMKELYIFSPSVVNQLQYP
ncbi:ATP-binding protein, partial [Candidatus Roizmanbacteria bacterium]|nr:ATP-binding protein [Candidatus Roizmanbacteria bacterium]